MMRIPKAITLLKAAKCFRKAHDQLEKAPKEMHSARQHIRFQAMVSPLTSGVLARCDKVEYMYTVAELWVVGGIIHGFV